MTTTNKSTEDVTVEGHIFLLDGVAYLKTAKAFYELDDLDFYERCRQFVKPCVPLSVALVVRRAMHLELSDGGFNFPDHRIRSSDYSVPLMAISHERESFHADRDVCQLLVSQEIERECE